MTAHARYKISKKLYYVTILTKLHISVFRLSSTTCLSVCLCVSVLSVSLQTLVPAVDWMPYLTEVFAPVPLTESEPVVVYAKEYLQKVSDLITKTNKRSDTLHNFFHFRVKYKLYVFMSVHSDL